MVPYESAEPLLFMEKGIYEAEPTDFSDFETIRFIPHMYDPSLYGLLGCGPTALSLISGINPVDLQFLIDDQGATSEEKVEEFLKKNNFNFCKLTLGKLTNSSIENNVVSNVIHPFHVLLLIQMYQKNMASYTVVWNNLIWHNYQVQPFTALELVNRPVIGGWIICHDNWKNTK